jgi:MSHA biogenesis protein MshP
MRRGAFQRIPRRQRGFLIIAAVFLLVVLAGLVAYLMTVSTTSQAASAADQNSAKAYQAARAGAEWGAYQLLRTTGTFKTTCDGVGATATHNLTFASGLSAFTATVTCTRVTLTEGAASVKAYRLVSNACNSPNAGACPNNATTASTYVEREVGLSLTN